MPVAYSWSPDDLDAFGFQELDRFAHVSDFQGYQVIAEMDARRSRSNVRPFIRDEFNRRAAQLQICEIDRHAGARSFNPILVSQFEAEDLSIELDCLFRLIGDDFDVINSLNMALPPMRSQSGPRIICASTPKARCGSHTLQRAVRAVGQFGANNIAGANFAPPHHNAHDAALDCQATACITLEQRIH